MFYRHDTVDIIILSNILTSLDNIARDRPCALSLADVDAEKR